MKADTTITSFMNATLMWIGMVIDESFPHLLYAFDEDRNIFAISSTRELRKLTKELNIRAKRMELNDFLDEHLNPNAIICFDLDINNDPFHVEANMIVGTLAEKFTAHTSRMHKRVFVH
jgi:hypothetical protein